MCKACQSFLIFLVFVFHFNYVLGSQINLEEIDPCDLMFQGKDIYKDRYPEASNFPLSRIDLPVEFHLNHSIPEQHRDIIREAASEWKTEPEPGSEFRLITISDEIDDSQWSTPQQSQSSKNVIYWLDKDQYNIEDIDVRNNSLIFAAKTFLRAFSPSSIPIPYVFIFNSNIVIYEEPNDPIYLTRRMFTLLLETIGIKPPEDMDVIDLQHLFVEKLSKMSSDDFYNMVIKLMRDHDVEFPNDEPEVIKKWVIEEVNKRIEDTHLASFEDYRDLMIREYSFDLTNIFNSSTQLKNHVLHEFGHALGLGHNDEPGTLMYDALNMTLVPYFPKNYLVPEHVDDLALHGLKCSPHPYLNPSNI